MRKLNSRKLENLPDITDSDCIRVLTHVKQVDEINKQEFDKLETEPRTYSANVHGDFSNNEYPTDKELTLKVGAHVMFVKNDSRNGIFNGLLGVVTELSDDSIKVKPKDKDSEITVQKAKWQDIEYTMDSHSHKIVESVKGSFEQFPVRLAWAITVHKSQGLTFDKAVLDLHRCFAPGQAYVALSRCRTLEGLYLTEYVGKRAVICDESVKNFFCDDERSLPSPEEIQELKKATFLSNVERLYEMSDVEAIKNMQKNVLKLIKEKQKQSTNSEVTSADLEEIEQEDIVRYLIQHHNVKGEELLDKYVEDLEDVRVAIEDSDESNYEEGYTGTYLDVPDFGYIDPEAEAVLSRATKEQLLEALDPDEAGDAVIAVMSIPSLSNWLEKELREDYDR